MILFDAVTRVTSVMLHHPILQDQILFKIFEFMHEFMYVM